MFSSGAKPVDYLTKNKIFVPEKKEDLDIWLAEGCTCITTSPLFRRKKKSVRGAFLKDVVYSINSEVGLPPISSLPQVAKGSYLPGFIILYFAAKYVSNCTFNSEEDVIKEFLPFYRYATYWSATSFDHGLEEIDFFNRYTSIL